MITSPPYNVSKDYDQDLSLKEYLNLLEIHLKKLIEFLQMAVVLVLMWPILDANHIYLSLIIFLKLCLILALI